MAREDLVLAPESLEALLGNLDTLVPALGPASAAPLTAVRGMIQRAIAARRDGDPARAVAEIGAAMQALAELAGGMDADEARVMAGVAGRFGTAVQRGDAATAVESVDLMRQRSGATPRGKA